MCVTVCIFVAHTDDTDVRVDKEAKWRSSMLFVSGHSDNVSVGIISFGETEKFAQSVDSFGPRLLRTVVAVSPGMFSLVSFTISK